MSMRALAIVACLMFVTGCTGRGIDTHTAGDASETCADLSITEASNKLASIAPAGDPREPHPTSWVGFEDLYELTWAAHQIVRGRIIEDCSPVSDAEGMNVNPDYSKRMLLAIDAIYRGESRDRILIPASSDGYANDQNLTFEVGDEVILFLTADGFPVGGPQGHWHVVDGRAVPFSGQFPELPMDTFAQALAASLHQSPPSDRDMFPSLDRAPAGPDLPLDRTPPLACDGVVPPGGETVESPNDLAWVSQRIVVGTVRDVRPATVATDPELVVDRSLRVPVTDYVVNIEQTLRGADDKTVTVRLVGGDIDGCAVGVFGGPQPSAGDRLVLFLRPLNAGVYTTSGGQHGLWKIDADGLLASNTPWSRLPQVVPVADLVRMVGRALSGEMPLDQWIEHDPIALDNSPLGDTTWPELPVPDGWTQSSDPNGQIAFAHPGDWTMRANAPDSLVTLTSWQERTAGEPVPAGAVRLTIRLDPGGRLIDDGSMVPVSAGMHLAVPYVATTEAGAIDSTLVSYIHDTDLWQIEATFGTPPGSDDPLTLAFFQLLRSIQHPAR
jgi:hypothetical protein